MKIHQPHKLKVNNERKKNGQTIIGKKGTKDITATQTNRHKRGGKKCQTLTLNE